MSTIKTDGVETRSGTTDLTLGVSGDTLAVSATNLRTNTVKDKGGNTLWVSDGSGNYSNVNSGLQGNLVLLSTQTASNSASVSFTTGIDSTYDVYIFKFSDINPATDAADISFQVSSDGGTTYAMTMTTSFWYMYHFDTTGEGVNYWAAGDQAQGTGYQKMVTSTGNEADEAAAGELHLYAPSSTTFVKHFYSIFNTNFTGSGAQGSELDYASGYVNSTSAINAIDFKMDSGNFDGVIKMYGLL